MCVKKDILPPKDGKEWLFVRFAIALLCLFSNLLIAQEISPDAKKYYQQALGESNSDGKVRFLQSALKLSPQFVDARLELGITLIDLQKYQAAIVQLDSALNFERGNAFIWYHKGRAYVKVPDNKVALRCYEKAIQLKGDEPEFHISLGQLHYEMKSYKQALSEVERALNIENAQAEVWYWKGRIHEATSDTANALKSYQRALNLKPNYKEANNQLARLEVENQIKAETQLDKTEPVTEKSVVRTSSDVAIRKENVVSKPETPASIQDEPDTLVNEPAMDSLSNIGVTKKKTEDIQSLVKPSSRGTLNFGWIAGGIIILLAVLSFVFYKSKTWVVKRVPDSEATETIVLPEDVLNTEFGRYRIEKELGRGGMGKVFKAYDLKLERPVAFKVIRIETDMDTEAIKERVNRFRREAKATAILNHPNIVSLYDFDEKDGLIYMTMEYVDGESVEEMLDKKKKLEVEKAVKIVRETSLALEYAHRNNIIHRDIKPSNIMINKEGIVKVLDFGVAKMLTLTRTQSYTMTGMRIGSPFYMSPEQIDAGFVDRRSDIWALGVVFYEMLTGKKPFKVSEGDSLARLFHIILNTEIPKPSSIQKKVPTKLDAIIEKMLAKNPDNRFQNVREIIHTLGSL